MISFAALILALRMAAAHAQVPEPEGILWNPTGNYWAGGPAKDAIVVHTTEGTYNSNLTFAQNQQYIYNGTINYFKNPNSQASAHYVISGTGQITQMVALGNRAWHATYYNNRSIGIEVAGWSGKAQTWNDQNLSALTALVAWLCDSLSIPVVHPAANAYAYPNNTMDEPGILSHAQIQPWNRTDPGPYFPWTQFVLDVQAAIDGDQPPAPPTGLQATPVSATSAHFSWSPSTGADGHWLDLALSQADLLSQSGTFQSHFAGLSASYTATGLAPGMSYFWRVWAYNAAGGTFGYPSGPVTLPGISPPPAPVLIAPASSALVTSAPVWLDWSDVPGIDYYYVAVFSSGVNVLQAWPAQSTVSFTPPSPGSHTWYVWSHNGAGWSSAASAAFTYQPAMGLPPPPAGLAPGGWTSVPGSSVTLSWQGWPGAFRYEVVIYYWNGASWKAYYTYTPTSPSVKFWPQVPATHYAWRVRTLGSSGWSDWPDWAYFYFQG